MERIRVVGKGPSFDRIRKGSCPGSISERPPEGRAFCLFTLTLPVLEMLLASETPPMRLGYGARFASRTGRSGPTTVQLTKAGRVTAAARLSKRIIANSKACAPCLLGFSDSIIGYFEGSKIDLG